MKAETVADIAEQLKHVRRPGFLAAYLALVLKQSSGRVNMGRLALRGLDNLAYNLTSNRIEVAFSDLLSLTQIERGMTCLRILTEWRMSEEERFRVQDDIVLVRTRLENLDPELKDKHDRVHLSDIQSIITELWREQLAVEKPQESQPT